MMSVCPTMTKSWTYASSSWLGFCFPFWLDFAADMMPDESSSDCRHESKGRAAYDNQSIEAYVSDQIDWMWLEH